MNITPKEKLRATRGKLARNFLAYTRVIEHLCDGDNKTPARNWITLQNLEDTYSNHLGATRGLLGGFILG